ncbi:MAG TPA: hypothetical protein VF989_16820 [Polyangiaceae bacterium]
MSRALLPQEQAAVALHASRSEIVRRVARQGFEKARTIIVFVFEAGDVLADALLAEYAAPDQRLAEERSDGVLVFAQRFDVGYTTIVTPNHIRQAGDAHARIAQSLLELEWYPGALPVVTAAQGAIVLQYMKPSSRARARAPLGTVLQ